MFSSKLGKIIVAIIPPIAQHVIAVPNIVTSSRNVLSDKTGNNEVYVKPLAIINKDVTNILVPTLLSLKYSNTNLILICVCASLSLGCSILRGKHSIKDIK